MREIARGDTLEGLQALIENHFDVGENVTVGVYFSEPLTQDELASIQDNLRSGGVKVNSLRTAEIEGQPGILVSFKRPAVVPASKIGFWPLLIVGAIGVAVIGYIVYKAGEGVQSNIVPIVGILVVSLIVWQMVKPKEGRHER
jgi:hypothetical protein